MRTQLVFRALLSYIGFIWATANGVIWFACLFDKHYRAAMTPSQHVLGFLCLAGVVTYIVKTSNLDGIRLLFGKSRKYRHVKSR